MTRTIWPAAMLLVVLVAGGCQTTATPNWMHPGDADTQRKLALRYDPYPEPGIGTSVADIRPRDYNIPPTDPARDRWFGNSENANRWWRPPQPPAAPPPANIPPPAVAAPPAAVPCPAQ